MAEPLIPHPPFFFLADGKLRLDSVEVSVVCPHLPCHCAGTPLILSRRHSPSVTVALQIIFPGEPSSLEPDQLPLEVPSQVLFVSEPDVPLTLPGVFFMTSVSFNTFLFPFLPRTPLSWTIDLYPLPGILTLFPFRRVVSSEALNLPLSTFFV